MRAFLSRGFFTLVAILMMISLTGCATTETPIGNGISARTGGGKSLFPASNPPPSVSSTEVKQVARHMIDHYNDTNLFIFYSRSSSLWSDTVTTAVNMGNNTVEISITRDHDSSEDSVFAFTMYPTGLENSSNTIYGVDWGMNGRCRIETENKMTLPSQYPGTNRGCQDIYNRLIAFLYKKLGLSAKSPTF